MRIPSIDDLKAAGRRHVQNGHGMGAVMRTLLLSPPVFFNEEAYRSRIKVTNQCRLVRTAH